MAIKTLRVFQEFTSEGFVPMPPQGNIDYGFTIAGTFPGTTPATYQLDDPDIDVEVTVMTDFYVWIRSHGSEWNINYTRNVRVYPDSPLINNVVMGIIIANALNGLPTGGTAGQILSKIDADDYNAEWIDNVADWTSQLKHEVKAGVVLTKGQAVYVSGADGTNMIVSKASNVNEAFSSKTMGLIAQNLNINAKGFVITEGLLTGLNTSSANAGDPVWLGVDGALIYGLTNKPYAPAHLVFIGIVTRSNNNNGEIFVKVQNGFELKEIHDVQILNPLNKNIIVYDSVTELWKNRNIFGTQGYLPYYDNTSLMLNSPFWTNGSLVGLGTITPTALLHMKGTTAYTNVILDNNSPTGGGMFSAYQNGAETAMFGADAYYQASTSIDAAIASKKAGSGIQFYTNGSQSEKMGINSDGNVFVGQTPTYVAGATQLIVRGKTGAGFLGVNHYDMSIKGFMNTFNSVFQVGTSTFHSLAFLVENSERGRVNSNGRLLWGTTTDNGVDLVQINGSLIASSIKKSGGTSSQYLMADGSVSTGSSLTASAPLSITSGVISISQSSASVNGFLSSTDWSNFNSKQSALSGTGFVKVSGSTISYDNTIYTPASRLLSINGTSYDLTADRAWTITPGSGMRNISSFVATGGQTTFTIVGGYTAGLVDVFVNGARLNYADYTATNGTTVVLAIGVVANDIVDIINYVASLTSGLTGAGTTNYIPKWSGSSNLTNSLIFDNGTNVGIGTASPAYKLDVSGTGRFIDTLTINTTSLNQLNIANKFFLIGASNFHITNGAYFDSGFKYVDSANPSGKLQIANNGNLIYSYAGVGLANAAVSYSDLFTIASSGNVGIGLTNPSVPLEVSGNIRATSSGTTYFLANRGTTTSQAGFQWQTNGTTNWYNYTEDSANTLFWYGNGAYRMALTSSGNLGIGTNAPLAYSGYTTVQASNTTGAGIYAESTTGAMRVKMFADNAFGASYIGTETNHGLALFTNNSEKLRILANGNVGINLTNPSQKLMVNQGVTGFNQGIPATSGSTQNGIFRLIAANGLYGEVLDFGMNVATTYAWIQATNAGNLGVNYNLSLNPNGGNVGIGTRTPSNLLTLGVATGDAVGSNTTLAITTNNQYGISADRKFLNINFVGFNAEIKAQIQSWDESGNTGNGTLVFNTRIGGVLGERMRIALDGKVGIGMSNPNDKLHVEGSVGTTGGNAGFFFRDRSSSTIFGWYATSGTPFLFNSNIGNIASINPSNGIYTPLSDVNKKKDFEESKIGLNEVLNLKPTLYRMKSENNLDKKTLGFIAQEVKKYIPQAYVEDGDFIGLSDRPIIAALVKAIQELNAKIEAK